MIKNFLPKFMALQILIIILGLVTLLALSTIKASPQNAAEDQCSFSEWIGKEVDEDALKKLQLPYRVLLPGAMVTTDYIEERINIHIDKDGIITLVNCG